MFLLEVVNLRVRGDSTVVPTKEAGDILACVAMAPELVPGQDFCDSVLQGTS